jgi:hypothetical protein
MREVPSGSNTITTSALSFSPSCLAVMPTWRHARVADAHDLPISSPSPATRQTYGKHSAPKHRDCR